MHPTSPLLIRKQGALSVGGEVVYCEVNDGANAEDLRFPPGHIIVDALYASYQYPANQKYEYPIIFTHGGGHSAQVYDTTPDGREGWLTLFLRAGFATYGADRVNSGRSGADIQKINAVRLARLPANELPHINRYAFEAAWEWFRWGPRYGEAFPDTQFPIDAVEVYYRQLLPTYRDSGDVDKAVAGLVALYNEVGPATLLTWSSSGLIGYLASVRCPHLVKGILAVETSAAAFDELPDDVLPALSQVPIYIVIGDRAPNRVVASRRFASRLEAFGGHVTVDVLPEAGIFGNGHTMMLEKNNMAIMQRMIRWLETTVYS